MADRGGGAADRQNRKCLARRKTGEILDDGGHDVAQAVARGGRRRRGWRCNRLTRNDLRCCLEGRGAQTDCKDDREGERADLVSHLDAVVS